MMIRTNSTHLLLISGLAAAALGGCVTGDADAPMRIIGNVAPEENCTLDSASNLFLDDGVIDSGSLQGYVFTPSVVNEITLIEGEATGPKTIYVEGANIEIEFYDTERFPAANFDPDLLTFRSGTSGSIEPGGGTNAFSFEIVPPELLAAIGTVLGPPAVPAPRTTLDVRIQMYGIKGGGEVYSRFFRYPVLVCSGCLTSYVGECADLPSSFIPQTGGQCNPNQDAPVDCCLDDDGTLDPADDFLLCPARAPSGA